MAITILAFIACYTPPALIAAWLSRPVGSTSVAWPGHLAFSCIFSTSAINPVIYCFRARKFRRALKQLLQDPCGKTAFLKTNHKQQVKQNLPRMNARGAAKGKKAENESEEARNIHTAYASLHQLPRNPNHCTGEIACRICAFDKGRNGLSKEEENGACLRNQVMPYLKRPSDFAETSSREENSTSFNNTTRSQATLFDCGGTPRT